MEPRKPTKTEVAVFLRGTADKLDPLGSIKGAVIAFLLGCLVIASMDYGDIWLCIGSCDGHFNEAK